MYEEVINNSLIKTNNMNFTCARPNRLMCQHVLRYLKTFLLVILRKCKKNKMFQMKMLYYQDETIKER